MIQCALRTKIEHISALSAFGLAALFLYHDICGVAYIKNAAEKGYAYAQYYLGMMYYYGKDVCQYYYNAYEFYHKAAEQGHALAQFGLAQMIEYKIGLPSSYYHDKEVRSEKWYYQAAQQGYEPARSKSVQWRLSRR